MSNGRRPAKKYGFALVRGKREEIGGKVAFSGAHKLAGHCPFLLVSDFHIHLAKRRQTPMRHSLLNPGATSAVFAGFKPTANWQVKRPTAGSCLLASPIPLLMSSDALPHSSSIPSLLLSSPSMLATSPAHAHFSRKKNSH